MPFTSADPGFPGLFGVPLLAGRDHHEPHDRRREETYLVTRSAAHALGFESPEQILGRHVGYTYRGRSRGEGRVVGVLEDFRFETLHVPAGPLVITNQWGVVYVAVRLQDVRAGLDHLRETWDGVNPDWPLDYRFLDDNFEAAYRTETRLGSVLTGFCFIAVVVAGIGVFALAAYTAQQRTREVGIRKVLGASSSSVVVLLAMEFARLGAIAGVVAAPLAYLGMTRWLERFADRVEPGPDVFIGSVAVVLLLALVATGGHALRAAWADPVQALRHE
jgi:putative ABC transport system permease protein